MNQENLFLSTLLCVMLSKPHLELDTLLSADTDIEWMFDLAHLGDEIGGFDQFGWGVAPGDDDV